ncbi:MAG: maleylpyruvate isomerase family mycothiol-dependent enzyme [Pseudonocardiaceae bacterium]
MAPLSADRYLDALIAQSAQFAEALLGSDLRQQVSTCPQWSLYQLTEHLGQAHRMVTALVTQRITAPVDPRELATATAPNSDDPKMLGHWLRSGAEELADAIREADPQTPVWSFLDDNRAAFWARRMAHETAVHRADAVLAQGGDFELEPDLAADAISEWLDILCSPQALEHRPELAVLRGDGQLLHLHSTDGGLGETGEWIIRRTPSGPVWEHGHAKGDVAVRGAVVDLLLVTMRRVPPDEAMIQVLGNSTVLDHWLAHTAF